MPEVVRPSVRAAELELGAIDRAFIFGITRRMLRHDDDAHDVTQDAMLLASRSSHQLRDPNARRAWLRQIAVTTTLALLRKRRRRAARYPQTSLDDSHDVASDPHDDPAANLLAGELVARLEAQLAPPYRELFALRLREWRDAEIAEALGISVGNVKIRVHRLRLQLRAMLDA